jgi:hypothetical protein
MIMHKVVFISTMWAAAMGLAVSLGVLPAWAAVDCTDPRFATHPQCDPNVDTGDGQGLSVQVTFFYAGPADAFAAGLISEPFIAGDGLGAYIDGVDKVTAVIPDGEDNAAPAQFQFAIDGGKRAQRHVYISFGMAVDCPGADPGTLGCVFDDSGSPDPVECPFDDLAAGDRCAGLVTGGMWVRDPIRIVGGAVVDDGLFVTMQAGTVSLSRAQDDEFNFYYDREKWAVNFDDVACNVAPPEAASFLDMVAFELEGSDTNGIREEWAIGTDLDSSGNLGPGTKNGCLVKLSKGGTPEYPNGVFAFHHGYRIELP